jgi:hypothetical protein
MFDAGELSRRASAKKPVPLRQVIIDVISKNSAALLKESGVAKITRLLIGDYCVLIELWGNEIAPDSPGW